jgi:preprotein translocase subunit SecY
VPLAIFQSLGVYFLLTTQGIVESISLIALVALVVTMTTGAMFAVWLGELIEEYGLGNGISFLIFAGIVARLPVTFGRTIFNFDTTDLRSLAITVLIALLAILTVGLIVFINEATRQVPINYARQGRRTIPGSTGTYLPLRLNQAGVIPIIFAVSLVLMPSLIAQFMAGLPNPRIAAIAGTITSLFQPQTIFYNVLYFGLVVGFTYFYTSIVFNPEKISENLQKNGGFIPGIRPGSQTIKYLNYVLNRVTLVGAIFLGGIAVFPSLLSIFIGVSDLIIGGTGLLITVSVVLELTRNIEAQHVMTKYDSLLR